MTAAVTPFGDGQHPTTAMVLYALDALDRDALHPKRLLDVGCGSGILTQRLCELFPDAQVWACDIDAASVVATRALLAAITGIAPPQIVQSDGLNHPQLRAAAPYDLITANLLAQPLLTLAADIAGSLSPDGVAIISGILVWQEDTVRAAYAAAGLQCTARLASGEWCCLIWQRETA